MDNKSICENNFAKHGNDYNHDKEFVVKASSSSLRLRNDNSANSPKNSNMDIAEHDEEFTVMASSSLPLSVIDASPNNIHFINMAQDTDEYAPVSSTSSLKRTTTIDTAHLTNEYVSVVSSSSLRRTSSSDKMLKAMFMSISVYFGHN
ncbi:hypothetical protein CK203_110448 [Vitis vinifera]|uniref:Uncharacterized protein n=1 Tax=Vitis vinifera TaxID=29760 RepID=A0A438BNC1_VITVI|nr:hypothetical protein CK203_110448 [Vitis vinifera]